MITKERAIRNRKCHQCGLRIDKGDIYVTTSSSGFYNHNVCMKCVQRELNKEIR